ncbi:RUS1 family protein [bacterium]|nr:RUS1 family protein [bacterium]
MKILRASSSTPPSLPKPPGEVVVKEQVGKEFITYKRDDEGHVVGSHDGAPVPSWLERTKARTWSSLVPDNLPNSVSPDYAATRKWQLTRDFFGTFAATSSLAAVTTAVGPANTALLALSIAGLSLANVTWIKQRLPQITQFASTGLATVAERNPKPWMLAADLVLQVSMIAEAATPLLPAQSYYALLTSLAMAQAVGTVALNSASAGVGPRQARANNLGEMTTKNSNQSTLISIAGATAGLAAVGALTGPLGFGHAALVVSTLGALAGTYAKIRKHQALEYDPINEEALRRVIDRGAVGPESNQLKSLLALGKKEKLTVGNRPRPLLQDANFPALRQLFIERPYMLSVHEGAPYIVMKDEAQAKDEISQASAPLPTSASYPERMAQVQAAYHAILLEKFLASPDYQQLVEKRGQSAAELEAVTRTFQQTPPDMHGFLQEMQKLGWSVDMVRFRGDSKPVSIQTGDGELTLEVRWEQAEPGDAPSRAGRRQGM